MLIVNIVLLMLASSGVKVIIQIISRYPDRWRTSVTGKYLN
jgi:hypothetical protein